jgi:hypothetical protein
VAGAWNQKPETGGQMTLRPEGLTLRPGSLTGWKRGRREGEGAAVAGNW